MSEFSRRDLFRKLASKETLRGVLSFVSGGLDILAGSPSNKVETLEEAGFALRNMKPRRSSTASPDKEVSPYKEADAVSRPQAKVTKS